MQSFQEQFKDVKAHGAVFYTDGSSRPNPGYTGSGIHGYLYLQKEMSKPVSGDGMVMTDRGYMKPPADPRSFVDPVCYIDATGSNEGVKSNNYAEVNALAKALEIGLMLGLEKIHIISDSRFALDGIGYCEKWELNGWRKSDGGEISNVEVWQSLYSTYKKLMSTGVIYTWDWIKGHEEHRGNTEADILSVIGTFRARKEDIRWDIRKSDPKGYWKNEVSRHPFLNIKRIFFNAEERFNSSGLYHQGDSGVGDFGVGKRTPLTSYSVVKLNEPDNVIEAIRQAQYRHSKGDNAIMEIKCDDVFSKRLFHWFDSYGVDCLEGDTASMNLVFTDKTPITQEKNPAGLAIRSIQSFNILEELLLGYVNYKEKPTVPFTFNGAGVQVVEVTSSFYDVVEKKGEFLSVLKDTFVVGVADIKLTFEVDTPSGKKEITVPYILGLDFLTRNNLKKLEAHSPKIHLVIWAESDKSYRYATVSECDSGIGIWSNYHADRLFINT